MPELSLDAVLGFLRAEIQAVRIDLGGRIDKSTEQNRTDHARVQESIQELGSEMRQVASTAAAARTLSEANANELAEHKNWHQRQIDRTDGADTERKRWMGGVRELWKVGLGVVMALAGVLLKAHFA